MMWPLNILASSTFQNRNTDPTIIILEDYLLQMAGELLTA